MVRLLTVGGVTLELASTAVSWGADQGQIGLAGCLAVNVALLALSMAYRVLEVPLRSLVSLPEQLSVEDGSRSCLG